MESTNTLSVENPWLNWLQGSSHKFPQPAHQPASHLLVIIATCLCFLNILIYKKQKRLTIRKKRKRQTWIRVVLYLKINAYIYFFALYYWSINHAWVKKILYMQIWILPINTYYAIVQCTCIQWVFDSVGLYLHSVACSHLKSNVKWGTYQSVFVLSLTLAVCRNISSSVCIVFNIGCVQEHIKQCLYCL